jgi:hypothetical protein
MGKRWRWVFLGAGWLALNAVLWEGTFWVFDWAADLAIKPLIASPAEMVEHEFASGRLALRVLGVVFAYLGLAVAINIALIVLVVRRASRSAAHARRQMPEAL